MVRRWTWEVESGVTDIPIYLWLIPWDLNNEFYMSRGGNEFFLFQTDGYVQRPVKLTN